MCAKCRLVVAVEHFDDLGGSQVAAEHAHVVQDGRGRFRRDLIGRCGEGANGVGGARVGARAVQIVVERGRVQRDGQVLPHASAEREARIGGARRAGVGRHQTRLAERRRVQKANDLIGVAAREREYEGAVHLSVHIHPEGDGERDAVEVGGRRQRHIAAGRERHGRLRVAETVADERDRIGAEGAVRGADDVRVVGVEGPIVRERRVNGRHVGRELLIENDGRGGHRVLDGAVQIAGGRLVLNEETRGLQTALVGALVHAACRERADQDARLVGRGHVVVVDGHEVVVQARVARSIVLLLPQTREVIRLLSLFLFWFQ